MYISRASIVRDFRDLSEVEKLNKRTFFGIAHHHSGKFICIEYQHFRDMICNIRSIM